MNISNLRKKLEQHPNITLGFIVASAVVSVSVLIWALLSQSADSTKVDDTWYYDLGNGKLFASPAAQFLPITSPSDPNATPDNENAGGVLAILYGCGGCESGQAFVGYVMTHNPQMVARARQHGTDVNLSLMMLGESTDGVWIKAFNRQANRPVGQWVPLRSPEGQQIINDVALTACEGQSPVRCGTP